MDSTLESPSAQALEQALALAPQQTETLTQCLEQEFQALKQRDLDIKAQKVDAEIANLLAETQQTRAETAGKAMALANPQGAMK